jgi:hypothetical protein
MQTATMSTKSQNRGNFVVSVLESYIKTVLIGAMPLNRHITYAKETLILMIDSLPEDGVLFNFISENINTLFKLNAEVLDHKINVQKDPWLEISKFKYSLFEQEGRTYLFTQLKNGAAEPATACQLAARATEYEGSAANYRDRIGLHKMQFRSDNLARALLKQSRKRRKRISKYTLFFKNTNCT